MSVFFGAHGPTRMSPDFEGFVPRNYDYMWLYVCMNPMYVQLRFLDSTICIVRSCISIVTQLEISNRHNFKKNTCQNQMSVGI